MNTLKFQLGDEVRHAATDRNYIICGLPGRYIIEESMETAYAYFPKGDPSIIWVRSKKKMEDGRFEKVTP